MTSLHLSSFPKIHVIAIPFLVVTFTRLHWLDECQCFTGKLMLTFTRQPIYSWYVTAKEASNTKKINGTDLQGENVIYFRTNLHCPPFVSSNGFLHLRAELGKTRHNNKVQGVTNRSYYLQRRVFGN